MIEDCKQCGNHENEDLCRKCNHCLRQHIQKYGIPWVQNKEVGLLGVPCPHICRFQLPNKQWITYKCTRNIKHKGSCNFPVDPKIVERMARDVSGR